MVVVVVVLAAPVFTGPSDLEFDPPVDEPPVAAPPVVLLPPGPLVGVVGVGDGAGVGNSVIGFGISGTGLPRTAASTETASLTTTITTAGSLLLFMATVLVV